MGFNMKKMNIVALFSSALMVAPLTAFAGEGEAGEGDVVVAPQSVVVDGGKVNFTGSVHAAPCVVDTSPEQVNIGLGQITTGQLAGKGSTGAAIPFTIKLVGCNLSPLTSDSAATTNYTKATIKFSGSTIDSTTLALTAAGAGSQTAQNVGIQIAKNNETVHVDGSTSAPSHGLPENDSGVYEIPFTATYVATDTAVVAGSANSSANFSVTYE